MTDIERKKSLEEQVEEMYQLLLVDRRLTPKIGKGTVVGNLAIRKFMKYLMQEEGERYTDIYKILITKFHYSENGALQVLGKISLERDQKSTRF